MYSSVICGYQGINLAVGNCSDIARNGNQDCCYLKLYSEGVFMSYRLSINPWEVTCAKVMARGLFDLRRKYLWVFQYSFFLRSCNWTLRSFGRKDFDFVYRWNQSSVGERTIEKPGSQVLSLFLFQFKFHFCTEPSLFVSGNLVCLIDKRRHYGSLYIVCITYHK